MPCGQETRDPTRRRIDPGPCAPPLAPPSTRRARCREAIRWSSTQSRPPTYPVDPPPRRFDVSRARPDSHRTLRKGPNVHVDTRLSSWFRPSQDQDELWSILQRRPRRFPPAVPRRYIWPRVEASSDLPSPASNSRSNFSAHWGLPSRKSQSRITMSACLIVSIAESVGPTTPQMTPRAENESMTELAFSVCTDPRSTGARSSWLDARVCRLGATTSAFGPSTPPNAM